MRYNFSKDFCQLCDVLSGKNRLSKLSKETVDLAQRLGVLDALVANQNVRKRLGKQREAFLSQTTLGALHLKEMRYIADAFNTRGIPLAPLKGMAYALMFDSGGPKRSMADIDLLVPSRCYEEACCVMGKLGYQETHPTRISLSPEYHERLFFKNRQLVEVHQCFLPIRRLSVNYENLWAQTIPMEKDGVSCRRLSPEDTFLYHCLHMGIHEFTIGFRPIWELYRLITIDKPDLSLAANRAREWKALRMVWCALQLFVCCFPQVLSKYKQRLFEPSLPIRSILRHFVIDPSISLLEYPGQLPRHVQLFRKALLMDSPANGLFYTWWYVRENLGAF